MKIMFLSDAHSVHTRRIADGLVQRGIEVELFSLYPADHPLSPQTYDERVKITSFNHHNMSSDKLRFFIACQKHILLEKPDIVWAAYASSYGKMMPFFMAKRKLISVWGSDVMVQAFNRRHRSAVIRGLRSADHIFATSNILRDYTMALTTTPISLTPFGPDELFFEPQDQAKDKEFWQRKFGLEGDVRFVICNKWMKKVYGVDLLIEAFSRIKDYARTQKLKLVLTGSGQDIKIMRQLVADLDLKDLVIFTEYLEQEDIVSLLSASDLAVYPSRSESFGVSILEALAVGVPIIATNVGGIPEVTNYGEHARLIERPDAQLLAREIISYFSSKPQVDRQISQERGKAFALQFKWSKCLDNMAKKLNLFHIGEQAKLIESGYDFDHRPVALFAHHVGFQESQTRARAVRVGAIRKELCRKFRVIEITADMSVGRARRKWLDKLLRENHIELAYVELPSQPFGMLRKPISGEALAALKRADIDIKMFIPDLHEMDDSYVNSPPIPELMHFARWRRRRQMTWLNQLNPTTFVPTLEFKEFMNIHFPDTKNWSVSPLPGGCSNANTVPEQTGETFFVYAGGVGPFYRMDRLFEALKHEPDLSARTRFFLRQKDIAALTPTYRERVESVRTSIIFDEEIRGEDHCVNVGLILTEPLPYFALAMPIKLFSYLERGWPILCTEGTALARLVEQNDLGWAVQNSTDAIKSKMHELIANPKEVSAKHDVIARFVAQNTWARRVEQIVQSQK